MALNPKSYCAYVQDLPPDNLHRKYHDKQYGFPLEDDDALFGRLILEINQAGLSWITILKKQDNFRKIFKFTGPEIVNEFLMSSGFKEGAHDPECSCYPLAKAEIKEHYGL
jgi:3-methyladenine DNA glycosylase Tag